MVEVLVTGGAGFIGSNFVRHALEAHQDWRITTLDKLTYAGRMETLKDVIDHPRHQVRPRRHRGRASRRAAGQGVEHRRPFRRRDPRRPIDSRSRGVHQDRRHRHIRAARGRARRGQPEVFRPDLDRRGLRQRRRMDRASRPTSCGRAIRTRPARRAPIAWPTATGRHTASRS